jgi:hypothetical protein
MTNGSDLGERSAVLDNRSQVEKLKERLNALKLVADRREEANKRLRERMASLQGQARFYGENAPVNRFLRFARLAYDAADALKADVMVAHGVQALPAAEIAAGRCGARLFCDVIEIPSFEDRVLESQWHPTNIRFLDLAFENT